MSGKEQHHIWRMLQRGFGEKRGADHHVWVYEKNKKPRMSGTGNFGCEKYFYGPEGSEVDKKITDFENSIQSKIQDARSGGDGDVLETEFCAALVAHLEVRSKFLRSNLSNLLERVVKSTGEKFSSPQFLRRLILERIRCDPTLLDSILQNNLIPVWEQGRAANLIEIIIENLPDEIIEGIFERDLGELAKAAEIIPQVIQDSHNKAILSLSDASKRFVALCEYKYYVHRILESQFILPDTCCAFVGPDIVVPFSQPDNILHTVIVPISCNVAIVGNKSGAPQFKSKSINRILAGCAYNAFVARGRNQSLLGLSSRISKYSKLMSEREITDLCSPNMLISLMSQAR